MINFKYKRTNQELIMHYCPPTPVADGSAGGTTQALPPGPTPVQAVPPGPIVTSFRAGGTARPLELD
jgi:hypothetical protein